VSLTCSTGTKRGFELRVVVNQCELLVEQIFAPRIGPVSRDGILWWLQSTMAFDEFTEYGSPIKYLFLFSQPPLSL
jgi:hypothetical protein|tara:strand:- start:909 stop:1136 length:228 start_codon:yes stop_codon:yes gene_type:complete